MRIKLPGVCRAFQLVPVDKALFSEPGRKRKDRGGDPGRAPAAYVKRSIRRAVDADVPHGTTASLSP